MSRVYDKEFVSHIWFVVRENDKGKYNKSLKKVEISLISKGVPWLSDEGEFQQRDSIRSSPKYYIFDKEFVSHIWYVVREHDKGKYNKFLKKVDISLVSKGVPWLSDGKEFQQRDSVRSSLKS